MVTKNDVTGDKLISKPNNKDYDDGYDRIYYPCKSNCTYLIDTLTKCKKCPHRPLKGDLDE